MISLSEDQPAELLAKRAETVIVLGTNWLIEQQDQGDGGWHSQTYGAMRGGASMTALALYAASHLSKQHYQQSCWHRGLEFLMPGIRLRGFVACPDGSLDFPTYSTAMILSATKRMGMEIPADQRRSMVDFLVTTQLTQVNGFQMDCIDFGGWDSLGGSGATGITSGTNLSVSMQAVEAIAGEEQPDRAATLERAKRWSFGCQNWPDGDGGFFFQPEKNALSNKALWEDESCVQPRSYGTPTCDGLSLMIATGVGHAEDRVRKAIHWLTKISQVDSVSGFDKTPPELGWKEGLKYYYYRGLSRVNHLLPAEFKLQQRNDLLHQLLKLQSKDGFWENSNTSMREDDPLIATCVSLIAISNLLRWP